MRSNVFETLAVLRGPLERAIAEADGAVDFDSVCRDVEAGRMQVFAGGRSVVLTQVQDYPKMKVLQICYGAGALHEMEPWLDAILEWGRRQGCSRVVMLGRKGWERTFLGRRLQPTHIVMEGAL